MPENIVARNRRPAEPMSPAETAHAGPIADRAPRIARCPGRFGRHTMLAGAVAFWSMAGLAMWLGARVVCTDGICRGLDFDHEVLAVLQALQRPWLDAILTGATWLGSIAILLPVALALSWRYRRHGPPGTALLLPIAVGGASLLAHAGKFWVARPRPDMYPALISMPADLSFPSAHAMQITAFAFAWVLAAGSRPGWAGVIAAALIVLAVAFSRLYLQVHFPSDVAIGMIAGATWVLGLRLALGARP
ncbi:MULTISPECIES: phosphatase PAP2 family protein [Betaproteobacteria]|uniref:phosphatase PAP2 family protein n=1 Tax=Betaproteobacteria TaxID=28216 RepID=UPI0025EFCB4F|nr:MULTISPECIES: phosphatase PAP2 family protein [Betaproteobacteria]MBL0207987.1 phosphatase PAP2 family protein [Propionivibrio sp.]